MAGSWLLAPALASGLNVVLEKMKDSVHAQVVLCDAHGVGQGSQGMDLVGACHTCVRLSIDPSQTHTWFVPFWCFLPAESDVC